MLEVEELVLEVEELVLEVDELVLEVDELVLEVDEDVVGAAVLVDVLVVLLVVGAAVVVVVGAAVVVVVQTGSSQSQIKAKPVGQVPASSYQIASSKLVRSSVNFTASVALVGFAMNSMFKTTTTPLPCVTVAVHVACV